MKPITFFPAEAWASAFRQLADNVANQGRDFLREEMLRLLEKIVEFTPPSTTSQGAAVVRKNIGQLVQPFAVNSFRDKSVQRLVETRDIAGFNAFARNTQGLFGYTAIDASSVPELHAHNRNNRGRVASGVRLKNLVLGTDVRVLRAYIAKEVARVGTAINAWTPALYFLGGYVMKPVSMPEGTPHGSYEANLADSEKPSVSAINRSPWAARADEGQRIIRNAQESRVVAMRSRLKFLLKTAGEKSGFKTAA